MRQSQSLLLGLLPWLAAASPLAAHGEQTKRSDSVSNANHIFNSIHDSMRQFGSSLNHNGMGVFVATVPEGTEFYHGTSNPYRVNGTEWLAFEPEHALIFARPRGPPPGRGRPGKRPGCPPPGEGRPGKDSPPSGAAHDLPSGMDDFNDHSHSGHYEHEDSDLISDEKHHTEKQNRPCRKTHAEIVEDDDPSREIHEIPASGTHHSRPPPPGFEGEDRQHGCGPSLPGFEGEDRHHGRHPTPPGPEHDREHRGPAPPHRRPQDGLIGALSRLLFQEPLAEDQPALSPVEEEAATGYLHTYRTKHALRLIYLDGQSAAKSTKGTLDVQDMVIRNTTDSGEGRGMFGEKERADQMCRIAREEWDDRVDGILRMEGGFEIILCSFAKHLDVVRITSTKSGGTGPGGGRGNDGEDEFNYYEAVAARYDGIGAGRVKLDYSNFVSVFASPTAVYFDKTGRPRVRNDSAETASIREDIKKMVLAEDSKVDPVNWQDVTDQIVARYADRIEYMTSGELKTAKTLKAEIERAIRPFVDYSARNASLEAERCATQFWPAAAATEGSTLAGRAVKETYQTLCSSLAFAAQEKDYKKALAVVKNLREYLAWPTWKRCRGCTVHEICVLPIWPMGSEEDFVQPKCASAKTLGDGRGSYWRGADGGHPPPDHNHW